MKWKIQKVTFPVDHMTIWIDFNSVATIMGSPQHKIKVKDLKSKKDKNIKPRQQMYYISTLVNNMVGEMFIIHKPRYSKFWVIW